MNDPLETAAEALPSVLSWGIPVIATIFICAGVLWIVRRVGPKDTLVKQLTSVAVVVLANIALVLALPFETDTRGQLLSLFGLVLTAVIALSSTTFVSNAMAGFMLRAVSGFHVGDFIRIGDSFGRVTERGLLHTEIQSEDRDLITLPNLYVITNPVRVVRRSGTLISATVSLGYDVHRARAADALKDAAQRASLSESFVRVQTLGDFSITYQVSAFLDDVGNLISKRSELNAHVLDALHEAGIEIVSPNFMNQRQLDPTAHVTPRRYITQQQESTASPEAIMFDKADLASRIHAIEQQRSAIIDELKNLKGAENTPELEIAWRERQVKTLDDLLTALRENNH